MDFWTKVRIWTKLTVFGLLGVFVLVFLYKNDSTMTTVWFFQDYSISVLRLLFFTFLFGIVTTLLLRTIYRTIKQILEVRHRGQTQKLERDLADARSQIEQKKTEPKKAEPLA